ncbi:MAG: hypothetical protein KatS3mg131_2601 [Candidatus Tectimicrobiota bacterium]|nr:MAG: hypothetical protein KatS3mg131_2601 [Candidatus Tectomicrobia bacterium]
MTTRPHTTGLTPTAVPMDMAMGMVMAKKPVMFGIKSRTGVAASSSTPATSHGEGEAAGSRRTTRAASQAPAPLRLSACASDSEAASTKKLAHPSWRSKSRQLSTPSPGSSRQTQASSAGTAGCQWCTASVSHSAEVPRVMSSTRRSSPDQGRAAVGGKDGSAAGKPRRWRR